MSNPRRFGDKILFRVTLGQPHKHAKQDAAELRSRGIQARIDTFQGEYAVWANVKKVKWKSKTKKKPKLRAKLSVPRGRLGVSVSASKYFSSLLPESIEVVKIGRDVDTGFYDIDMTKGASLSVYEAPTHLEVLILFVPEKERKRGLGTIIVKTLKKYVDSKRIGLAFRDVHNTAYFRKFKWLKPVRSTHIEYNPSRGYRVKGAELYDIPLDPREVKSRANKKPQRAKIITLYHGTSSLSLRRVKKSGYVVGYWAVDRNIPLEYSVARCAERKVSEAGYPIVFVAKVPENIIIWDYEGETACGFDIPKGQFKSPVYKTIDVMTGRLSNEYIIHVLHYKPRGKRGMNVDWIVAESILFSARDWEKRKL